MKEVNVVIGPRSIGQAIARRVVAGKHVLLADLREENVQAAAKTLEEAGFEMSTTTVDISSSNAWLGQPAGSPVGTSSLFQASLGARYDVDLFGRVASNVSTAQANAQGSSATFRSVLLALQADVAQTYFRLHATDAELDLLKETVLLREENVRINGRRFALGDIGELDLSCEDRTGNDPVGSHRFDAPACPARACPRHPAWQASCSLQRGG